MRILIVTILQRFMLTKKLYFIVFLTLTLLGCTNIMDEYESPNFNKETGRFEHLSGDKNNKSFADLFGWAVGYFTRENDEAENNGFPVIRSSKKDLKSFTENVIWVGHASLLVNHSNVTILTDPQFADRASPFSFMGPKRVTPVPFSIADLPMIDVVVISHNHYDHLDEQSIRDIATRQPQIKFLVPLGLKQLMLSWGAQDVTELDWWQPITVKGVTIQPTPVQHWSKRSAFDRNKTLWSGWMMNWPDFSFYFAGDTGYSDDFIETARRLGSPDLAAIPIGAYKPRDFMKSSHINPEEAVTVFTDLGAKYAIGIHWGTFKLTLEPMDEPPRKLAEALQKQKIPKQRFRALKHGEAWPEVFAKK